MEEDFHAGLAGLYIHAWQAQSHGARSSRPSKSAPVQFTSNVSGVARLSAPTEARVLCRQRDGACVGLAPVHNDKSHDSQQGLRNAVRVHERELPFPQLASCDLPP